MESEQMFSEKTVFMKIMLWFYNVCANILLGMIVGIAFLFAAKRSFSVAPVREDILVIHIVLCVSGFILIMSQSVLVLSLYNTGTSGLSTLIRKRTHSILQGVGATLGLMGCIVMIVNKNVNFDTLHGRCGLATLILITVNMFFGLATVFSYELRKLIPPVITKIIHMVLGIAAYTSAITCLCFAFYKDIFFLWTSSSASDGVIVVSMILGVIVLIHPVINLFKTLIESFKSGCGTSSLS